MSAKRKSSHTEVVYDVENEPQTQTLHNTDQFLSPHTAKIVIEDGELTEIYVMGWVVKRNGTLSKTVGVAMFDADEMTAAPEWLRDIIATEFGRASA